MKNTTFKMKPIKLAVLLAGIGMAPVSYAAVDLIAVEGTWTSPAGAPITMWGFATGNTCPAGPVTWNVGPQLSDADLVGGDLTINLRNCLSDTVSIIIPGQPASFNPTRNSDGRITAFTTEAAANGGTASYIWTGVKDGTYLYQSGSHPAKQVQMGLYGALTIGNYPNTSDDVTLLYSEIDPALHNDPISGAAAPKAATPLDYHPRYFLVNGSTAPADINTGGLTPQPKVLRFLNAGLDFHVPALNSGYMTLLAEDGNAYPFSKQQYSVNLAAGKTIDAEWHPTAEGNVIYDRRGNGMVANLSVGADAIAPVITVLGMSPANVVLGSDYNDAGATAVDNIDGDLPPLVGTGTVDTNTVGTYTITYTATDAASNTATAERVVDVTATDIIAPVITLLGDNPVNINVNDAYADAGVTAVDNFDSTVTVNINNPVPDPTIEGTYIVTYDASDAAGNAAAQVTRTVNVNAVVVAPVATADSYPTSEDALLTVTAPGVLGNDGSGLNAILVSGPSSGTLSLLANGSFSYIPAADFNGTDSFTYKANNGTLDSNVVTVSLAVNAVHDAPVAVEDTQTIPWKQPDTIFINLTDNDSDADNNLKDINGNVPASQIKITTGEKSSRGGQVVAADKGVQYKAKRRRFRGTDTFKYTVTDLNGDESNEVTVKINVVK